MRAIVILLLGVLAFAAPAWAQRAAERITGPAVKVGDVWMFNKINARSQELEDISVNTVKAITGRGIVMESTALDGSGASKIQRTRDFNLVRIEAPNFVQQTLPHYPNFSFPLWVGKTWKGKVEFLDSRDPLKTVSARLVARVVGWESVTVPAGNFMALKIVMTGEYSGVGHDFGWPLYGDVEDTLWYAPEVRNAVRYEYRDTANGAVYNHEVQELVRYWLTP